MHSVELLDDLALVVVLLDLVFTCDPSFDQRVDQVLENLPEQKEVVALSDYEVHRKEDLPFLIQESLKAILELESDGLVDMEHLKHQLFDLLDSDDLESFIEKFDQVTGCTSEECSISIDFDFYIWVGLLSQDIGDHWNQCAMDLDSVRVANSQEAIIEGIVSASKIDQ